MKKDDFMAVRQVELNHVDLALARILKKTRKIQCDAAEYLSDIVLNHWGELELLDKQKQLTRVEQLMHKTKKNQNPEYEDFDTKFPKLPSYIRRAVINAVTGAVSSYMTRLADYEDRKHDAMSNGRRFREKPPKYAPAQVFITLYNGNAFKRDGRRMFIKVFIRNTWDWLEVSIPNRDRKDLARAFQSAKKVHNPSLVCKHGKYYLVFPIHYHSWPFPKTPLDCQTVLGVDLGINHGAVCSMVDAKGNIHGRAFDPFSQKRGMIDTILRRIRYKQRKSGTDQKLSALYQKLDGVKDDYVKQLARWIVNLAAAHNVYGIVLEFLGKMKARGRKKDRIHHWCKCKIRDYVKRMALRCGIRVFLINPKNTSALAFDGSGKVVRDSRNFSQCTFASGKQYNCDLSASYNIGARYFLRALQNSMSSEAWEQLSAKVPDAATRTKWTLSTLRQVSALQDTAEAAA